MEKKDLFPRTRSYTRFCCMNIMQCIINLSGSFSEDLAIEAVLYIINTLAFI